MISIEINKDSGFCFGVVKAISKAEEEIENSDSTLYCLGDIVHNNHEQERLQKKGLVTINHEEFAKLKNAKVLLRAHGEPPSTYKTAQTNNIEIIDASCPVVLRLQKKIKDAYEMYDGAQIVIFGKKGHAEVVGLEGQTENTAIIIENENDIERIDPNKKVKLFSQTTMSLEKFNNIVQLIGKRQKAPFEYNDTICRQVANRMPNLRSFAEKHDLVFFVSGEKSSNGKVLFEECKKVNPNTFLIQSKESINTDELNEKIQELGVESIGICGATSTPKWLMQEIEERIKECIG
ncbi:MAG: 4-hydroxy-3-methylbut-2-enyl diphosphate reductase [Bacteroidales bacterium]|jgi:4-hydroxy-3-methylbut-2-enyl diphosphate reductase|nr:4-hydroxy-3-methylbut-2-enyl diphosphate reductase [Bacteroidales bacterium]MBP5135093.1 4-hydroxy-3-methylbut-2-enyl diphosphate reductase [Paludibacteraceae bacterium]MDD6358205.1 4-hydroxy-3-methylbut-2-enyl diphosphate reductase [Bacteroidales bacterium]